MIFVKDIGCKFCDFRTQLATKVHSLDDDEPGLVTHTGWGTLRDHYDRNHIEYIRRVDQWIEHGTAHKVPNVEIDEKRVVEVCGTAAVA